MALEKIRIFQIVVELLCLAVFAVQISSVVRKFLGHATLDSMESIDEIELQLPSVTICPGQAWKERKVMATHEAFMNNSYRKHEIFDNETIEQFEQNQVNLKSTFSYSFGLCYTIQCGKLFQPSTFLKIGLRKTMDYKLIAHESGEEYWFLADNYPYQFSVLDIASASDDKTGGMDIRLEKQTFTKLSKLTVGNVSSCIPDTEMSEFQNCARNALIEELNLVSNCSTPILGFIPMNSSTLLNCTQDTEALQILKKIWYTQRNTIMSKKCVPSCTRITYNLISVPFASNVVPFSSSFQLWIGYMTTTVKQTTEQYVYDSAATLVAVGGSMGLFIGYSFKDVIFHVGCYLIKCRSRMKRFQ